MKQIFKLPALVVFTYKDNILNRAQKKRGNLRREGKMQILCRSRIRERTISLRFPGTILRVLRLEVSVWISYHWERGMVFYQFSSFLLYRNGKRLREFEEIEMSRQSFCTAACVFYENVSPTAA
jgi:hypothetical protein